LIIALLLLAGFAAGFINTLAGGGSTLVLPVLILAGIPSTTANATNRIAILFQNMIGVNRFHKYGKLEINSVIHITIASIIGAIAGSAIVSKISSVDFDKILGIIFIFVLILMLRSKRTNSQERKKLPQWLEFLIFLLVGFYGGFVQVGIGFVLLATLNLIEDYDLIRANAIKVFIVLCYTIFAVVIFALNGKMLWKYGLILAVGNSLGAYIGVKVAIRGGEKIVKLILTIAIVIACLKLFGFFNLFQ
jgi:uncharacterized membrane protein YfcA